MLDIFALLHAKPPPNTKHGEKNRIFHAWRAIVTSGIWRQALIGPCLSGTFIVWQRGDPRKTLQSWGYLLLPAPVLSSPCQTTKLNSRGGMFEQPLVLPLQLFQKGQSCLRLWRGCFSTVCACVWVSVTICEFVLQDLHPRIAGSSKSESAQQCVLRFTTEPLAVKLCVLQVFSEGMEKEILPSVLHTDIKRSPVIYLENISSDHPPSLLCLRTYRCWEQPLVVSKLQEGNLEWILSGQ